MRKKNETSFQVGGRVQLEPVTKLRLSCYYSHHGRAWGPLLEHRTLNVIPPRGHSRITSPGLRCFSPEFK